MNVDQIRDRRKGRPVLRGTPHLYPYLPAGAPHLPAFGRCGFKPNSQPQVLWTVIPGVTYDKTCSRQLSRCRLLRRTVSNVLPMDSKVVSRQIRIHVWPVLKAAGFDHLVGRNAWRHSRYKVDVLNFQSFNSYLATQVGCTTFSFSLNLGCYLTFVPALYGDSQDPGKGVLLPQEYECHLRRRLRKTIPQP